MDVETAKLPPEFADLEQFSDWCLGSEPERYAKRLGSSMAELQAFYDAITPRAEEAIAYCESVRDYVSREIFEKILDDTEEHIDWLETQIDLIGKVGLQNYQQTMMGTPE